MSVRRPRRIPLWLKLPWTLFVCVLVPVYAWYYGPANFLWFSNLALLAATVSLWLEHRLLAGMAALAVVLPEMVWIADFIVRLVAGWAPVGIAEYMWDGEIPLGVRLLSLYHIPLPLLLLWLVWRLGYDRRALRWQTAVAWVVLPLSHWAGDAEANINWTYGFGEPPSVLVPGIWHVLLLMLLFPLVIYLPTHLAFRAVDRRRGG